MRPDVFEVHTLSHFAQNGQEQGCATGLGCDRMCLVLPALRCNSAQGSTAEDEIRTLRQALEEKEASLKEPGSRTCLDS